jgi:hypothetical protein
MVGGPQTEPRRHVDAVDDPRDSEGCGIRLAGICVGNAPTARSMPRSGPAASTVAAARGSTMFCLSVEHLMVTLRERGRGGRTPGAALRSPALRGPRVLRGQVVGRCRSALRTVRSQAPDDILTRVVR